MRCVGEDRVDLDLVPVETLLVVDVLEEILHLRTQNTGLKTGRTF